MNHRQLETFYWAARLGSFARASAHLNATQSAISTRIQELEAHLAVTLFDRTRRSARITAEGAALLPLVQEVLDAAERLEQAAGRQPQVAGYVRLGVTEIVALTWLPELLSELRSAYPAVQVEIEVSLSQHLERKLERGTLDLIFAASDMQPSEFVSRQLGMIQFVWVAGPGLDGLPDMLTPETIPFVPIIATSREWQFRGSTLTWLTSNEVRFRKVTICNTFRTAASLAIAGLGVAYVPEALYRAELESGSLRKIDCWPLNPPLNIFSIAPLARLGEAAAAVSSIAGNAAARHPCWITIRD
ncbi:LysR family transcriptional regulator [Nitratireductor sp. GZWM139]|uniref:LysR family transcriptional regulator n=1 Tax=Nitratireductor sp. GZWM139 TaxID=2950541 RepID=UPI0024BECD61|nr:LysR family transcriptional regulator [Nitratireductor sp. GZWM139]MDJ1466125.1 LysR family transcriptional regulator [Nitratireductor sp. GZWM139]